MPSGQGESCCSADGCCLVGPREQQLLKLKLFPEAVMDMQTPYLCLHTANQLSQFIQPCLAQPVC